MIKKTLSLILLLLLFASCVREDLSVCGLDVVFKYDYNIARTDKFPSEINKVNLFVFDKDNIFVGEYIDQGEHLDSKYRMHLDLVPGVYSLIAWGNLGDDYELAKLTPGVTTLEQAKLSLKTDAEGYVRSHPGDIYFGAAGGVVVSPERPQEQLISFMKNSNKIRVTARGLPYDAQARSKSKASGTPFTCRISDMNSRYNFDNSLSGSDPLVYQPRYNVSPTEFVAEFVVLRILPTGQSRIVVEYISQQTNQPVEIFNERLVRLLPPGTDLDMEDWFDVVLEFNHTFTSVTVTVNDWVTVIGEQIIG